MSEKGLELLAPAGSLSVLKKVVDAGCDAVYFGGDRFGARAYATNFSMSEAVEGIRYAHLFGKKAFLTLNTLIKNVEYDELIPYIKAYYEAGIDAVLVQDFSVLSLIRKEWPTLPVHASTQMSAASRYGVDFLKNLGLKRVVLARELSLKEIKEIYDKTNMELEAFVHGAICVSYSGQCFFSSMLGGRSGNRGRCAQPCRLPYDVMDDDRIINTSPQYPLSPKDMNLIDFIPDLSNAGVYSLKIEGRMKSLEYATGIVSVYRKYIDRFLGTDLPYDVSKEDKDILLGLGNRGGFTSLYMNEKNGKNLMSLADSSLHSTSDKEIIPDDNLIDISCHIRLKKNEKAKIVLTDISYKNDNGLFDSKSICQECKVSGDLVEEAKNKPLQKEDVIKQINKTGNSSFSIKEISLEMDQDIFMPVSRLNELRRDFLSCIEDMIIDNYNKNILDRDNNKKWPEKSETNHVDETSFDTYIEIRTEEQLNAISSYLNDETSLIINYDYLLGDKDFDFKKISGIKNKAKSLNFKLPEIIRSDTGDLLDKYFDDIKLFDRFIVSSYDGLYFFEEKGICRDRIILDHRLYTYNNHAINEFKSLGYKAFIGPLELNKKELGHRENSESIMEIYGYAPLMITANCTNKNYIGCDKKSKVTYLKDRKGQMIPVQNTCSICMNTVLNTLPLCLFNDIDKIRDKGFMGCLISFTIEDGRKTEAVIRDYLDALCGNKKTRTVSGSTRGHFNRGVE